jgi:GNAT superfamily N-acetyltransferase
LAEGTARYGDHGGGKERARVIELFRRIVPELGTTVWLRDGRRDGDHEEVVAVARFHLLGDGKAEAAMVVRDDHQGVGLGTRLLGHLLSLARWAGVSEFSGEVLASNTRMLQLLKLGGASVSRARAGGVEFSIPVRSRSLPFRVLRAFASEAARFATLGRSAG